MKGVKRTIKNLLKKEENYETISDEFITWLVFANAGFIDSGNIWCLDYAIQNLPSTAPIIEIGSFCGLSANIISYLKAKYKVSNQLICCDSWNFDGSNITGKVGEHPYINWDEYREFIKYSFMKNVSVFSQQELPFLVELSSDIFFKKWENSVEISDVFNREMNLGGAISFAYIDGCHLYDFVLNDFQNVDRYLEVGGFILFDDSADGSGFEVCNVMLEVERTNRYKVVKKNPNYLFKKLQHKI